MPYIYKITNQHNGKIYIGKTMRTVAERWKEHLRDYSKNICEKRPLYEAMKKYGVESFCIETIEVCSDEVLNEREKFWIEYYGSFKKGYNATKGGDGKPYLDYDVLTAAYLEMQSLTAVAEKYHCDRKQLAIILKARNVQIISSEEVNRNKFGKVVNQYSLNGDYIQTFSSARQAVLSIKPEVKPTSLSGMANHITDVCKGKRKTAYGFLWKFI